MSKAANKTKIDEINEKLELLYKRRLQVYELGLSMEISDQIERMIKELELERQIEYELEKIKRNENDDGESFIV